MSVYTERLRVPLTWWLAGLAIVAMLGAEVIAGFGWPVALVVYGVLGGGTAAMLATWGRARIEVTGTELRAGQARLPLPAIGEVSGLSEEQARALRGPRADPRAYVLARPYLRQAVWVRVAGPGQHAPYWLIATRHPAELAQALMAARATVTGGGPAMG